MSFSNLKPVIVPDASLVDKDGHDAELSIKHDLDALLVAVGQNKDKPSFIKIFEYFAPRIKSFLIKGGAQPDQAEELVQETMLAIWDRAESYNPSASAASTWIFTIARNKKIDALRKSKYHHYDPNDVMDSIKDEGQQSAEDQVVDRQREQEIEIAMKSLPQEQADLIRMSFFDGMAHADIASKTKLPLGTVKSRIRLALDRIRRHANLTQDMI
jgi:RNA polymerase sigma factor (sigma-70 family)